MACGSRPIPSFDEKKSELASTIETTFEKGCVTHQLGKAIDAWIRLEGQIQMEMMIRDRLAAGV